MCSDKSMTMEGKHELPNVVLRALEPEDLDLLYDVENNRELWDAGCTNVPYSRHKLLDYIVSCKNDIFADQQLRLMIDNADGQTVGIIDLMNYEPRFRRAEVGIVVLKRFRGMGYASAALNRVIGYAGEILHLHQLYAIVEQGNAASLRVFAASGFSRGVFLRDWMCRGDKFCDALLVQLIL